MKKIITLFTLFLLIAVPAVAFTQYDPLVERQWYLDKISIFDAWDITQGDRDIIVAVLDTGVDISHPDLSGNIWVNMDEVWGDGIDNDDNGYIDDINGYDFVYDWPEPTPDTFWGDYDDIIHHGTFIAGIIAAVQNDQGIMGVANKVRIMPIKVLDEFGFGYSDIMADAIDYAVDNGADVINLSLAGFESNFEAGEAIQRAAEKNVIVVAASGNGDPWTGEGMDLDFWPVYPVCYDKDDSNVFIIGVGSTDEDDYASIFSNYGKECLDVSAPGELMYSTKISGLALTEEDYYGNDSDGTSYSSGVVTGVIALMKSLNRSLSPNDIMDAFKNGADPINLDFFMDEGDMGVGRINAYTSLKEVLLKFGRSQSKFPWKMLVTQASKGTPTINLLDRDLEIDEKINVFDTGFADGLVVEAIDVNNDGNKEYVVLPARGSVPMLRILSLDQKLLASRYIFESSFTGSASLSAIEMEDETNKILVCSGSGRQTEVMILDENAEQIDSFIPFNDKSGCNASAGDVDNDGVEEIVVASLNNNEVKIFDQSGSLINSFPAYESKVKGVNLDVADIDNDGTDEIVTGPYSGPGQIKLFDKDGKSNIAFWPYNENFSGGAKVKVTFYEQDERANIAVVPSIAGGPHLRIFNILGKVIAEKFIFESDFEGGLNIAVWK